MKNRSKFLKNFLTEQLFINPYPKMRRLAIMSPLWRESNLRSTISTSHSSTCSLPYKKSKGWNASYLTKKNRLPKKRNPRSMILRKGITNKFRKKV